MEIFFGVLLESVRQFLIQESNFYSLLESTKWLKYVSYCLQKSVEASELLNTGVPVILQGTIEIIIKLSPFSIFDSKKFIFLLLYRRRW